MTVNFVRKHFGETAYAQATLETHIPGKRIQKLTDLDWERVVRVQSVRVCISPSVLYEAWFGHDGALINAQWTCSEVVQGKQVINNDLFSDVGPDDSQLVEIGPRRI